MGRWLITITLALVAVAVAAPAPADAPDDLVLFHPGIAEWQVRAPDGSIREFSFGEVADVPLWGDWDCDGTDSAAVFRPDTGDIVIDDIAGTSFDLGMDDGVPVAGDWNGNGCDTVSMYRLDRLHVFNTLGGLSEGQIVYGGVGDVPIVGDFTGDGITTLAVFRAATGLIYLRNTLDSGFADVTFAFGEVDDYLAVGDWDGNGTETLALFYPDEGTFHLRNTNADAAATEIVEFGGNGWITAGTRLGNPIATTNARPLLLLLALAVAGVGWFLAARVRREPSDTA